MGLTKTKQGIKCLAKEHNTVIGWNTVWSGVLKALFKSFQTTYVKVESCFKDNYVDSVAEWIILDIQMLSFFVVFVFFWGGGSI